MKLYLLKFKALVFTALLIGGSSHLAAHKFEEYLEKVEKKFLAAKSKEEKFKIVTQLVNKEVLSQGDVDLDDEKALSAGIGPDFFSYTVIEEGKEKKLCNFKKTNPLMLAISLGDDKRFEKFLSVVDDVNDSRLTAWGYRQPYYLAHMALDPHIALDPKYPFLKEVPLTNRLRIIDLLGEKKADFNKLIGIGLYNNPPLIISGIGGSMFDDLRARSLLYGADPLVQGSSGTLVRINPTKVPLNSFGSEAKRLCAFAFDQYLKMPSEQQKKVRLAESVKEKFQKIKTKKLKQLTELAF